MAETEYDRREREIRENRYFHQYKDCDCAPCFLLRCLDEARAKRDLEAKKRFMAEQVIVASAQERDSLQAKLDAAMRVVEAVRKLKFGAYPAHGYGFVTIVTGGADEVQTALAAFDAAMKETQE